MFLSFIIKKNYFILLKERVYKHLYFNNNDVLVEKKYGKSWINLNTLKKLFKINNYFFFFLCDLFLIIINDLLDTFVKVLTPNLFLFFYFFYAHFWISGINNLKINKP